MNVSAPITHQLTSAKVFARENKLPHAIISKISATVIDIFLGKFAEI
jgi:hypothetical protein